MLGDKYLIPKGGHAGVLNPLMIGCKIFCLSVSPCARSLSYETLWTKQSLAWNSAHYKRSAVYHTSVSFYAVDILASVCIDDSRITLWSTILFVTRQRSVAFTLGGLNVVRTCAACPSIDPSQVRLPPLPGIDPLRVWRQFQQNLQDTSVLCSHFESCISKVDGCSFTLLA